MEKKVRESSIKRETSESIIEIKLNLDGVGKHNINTGIAKRSGKLSPGL